MLRSEIEPDHGTLGAQALQAVDRYRWAVAMLWSGRERKALEDLARAGFFPYLPLGSRIAYRTVGRASGLERRVRYVGAYRPFGAYVFVGQDARPLGRSVSRHIVDVIGDEFGPWTIAREAIRAICQAECAGEWAHTGKAALSTGFKTGQDVRIKEGAFAGFVGVVRALQGELRYKIEMNLFGRPTKVTLEACQLELQ